MPNEPTCTCEYRDGYLVYVGDCMMHSPAVKARSADDLVMLIEQQQYDIDTLLELVVAPPCRKCQSLFESHNPSNLVTLDCTYEPMNGRELADHFRRTSEGMKKWERREVRLARDYIDSLKRHEAEPKKPQMAPHASVRLLRDHIKKMAGERHRSYHYSTNGDGGFYKCNSDECRLVQDSLERTEAAANG